MKHSSYHNSLQAWIRQGKLLSYEITLKKINSVYDEKTRLYKPPKMQLKVLALHFDFNKSFYVREPYIEEYLQFIEEVKNQPL